MVGPFVRPSKNESQSTMYFNVIIVFSCIFFNFISTSDAQQTLQWTGPLESVVPTQLKPIGVVASPNPKCLYTIFKYEIVYVCYSPPALLQVVNETMLGGRSIISWSRSTTAQSTFYFIADFESPTNELGRLYALKGSGPFVLEDVGLDVLHNTIHTYANAGSDMMLSTVNLDFLYILGRTSSESEFGLWTIPPNGPRQYLGVVDRVFNDTSDISNPFFVESYGYIFFRSRSASGNETLYRFDPLNPGSPPLALFTSEFRIRGPVRTASGLAFINYKDDGMLTTFARGVFYNATDGLSVGQSGAFPGIFTTLEGVVAQFEKITIFANGGRFEATRGSSILAFGDGADFVYHDGSPLSTAYSWSNSSRGIRSVTSNLVVHNTAAKYSSHMTALDSYLYFTFTTATGESMFGRVSGDNYLGGFNVTGCVSSNPTPRGAAVTVYSDILALAGYLQSGTVISFYNRSSSDIVSPPVPYFASAQGVSSSPDVGDALSMITPVPLDENHFVVQSSFFHTDPLSPIFTIVRHQGSGPPTKYFIGDTQSCGGTDSLFLVHASFDPTGSFTILGLVRSSNTSVVEAWIYNFDNSTSLRRLQGSLSSPLSWSRAELRRPPSLFGSDLPVQFSPSDRSFYVIARTDFGQLQVSRFNYTGQFITPFIAGDQPFSYARAPIRNQIAFRVGVYALTWYNGANAFSFDASGCPSCDILAFADSFLFYSSVGSVFTLINVTYELTMTGNVTVPSSKMVGVAQIDRLSQFVSLELSGSTLRAVKWTTNMQDDLSASVITLAGSPDEISHSFLCGAMSRGALIRAPAAGRVEYRYWDYAIGILSVVSLNVTYTTREDSCIYVPSHKVFVISTSTSVLIFDPENPRYGGYNLKLAEGKRMTGFIPPPLHPSGFGRGLKMVFSSTEKPHPVIAETYTRLVYLPWQICSAAVDCPSGFGCVQKICLENAAAPSSGCVAPAPFINAICVAGVWIVQGNVEINSTIVVGSNTKINGSLLASGNATIVLAGGATLDVSQCVSFDGTLEVSSPAPLQTAVNVSIAVITFAGYCGNATTRFSATSFTLQNTETCAKQQSDPQFAYNDRSLSVTFSYDRSGCDSFLLSPGALAGIVVGGVALIAIILTIVLVLKCKGKIRPYAGRKPTLKEDF